MKKKYLLLFLLAVIALFGGAVAMISNSDNEMAFAVYTVDKMTCGSCVSNIQDALKDESGVGRVYVNVTSGLSQVEFDPERIGATTIGQIITSSGYPARLREELSAKQYLDMRTEESRLGEIYVARVGTRLVPKTQLDALLKQQHGRLNANTSAEKLRLKVWNEILQQELLLYAAEKNRVVVQDSEVEDRIVDMKKGMTNFDALVAVRYGSHDQFKRVLKNDMIINRNIELNVVGSNVNSDQRQFVLQKWYQQLVETTPVTIFDQQLKTLVSSSGDSGCGCCG